MSDIKSVAKWDPKLRAQIAGELKYLTSDEQKDVAYLTKQHVDSGADLVDAELYAIYLAHDITEMDVKDLEASFNRIKPIDSKGREITLIKSLGISVDQRVYLGQSDDSKVPNVVVKWGIPSEIKEAIANWERIIKLGINTPVISLDYVLWNIPCIVFKILKPLSDQDDPYVVGKAVLETLRVFHMIGVHCDLKPDNIMKDSVTGEYYVIDYDSSTFEPLYYGYQRKVWSPRYCSQVYSLGTVTLPKYDLIELIYTLHGLILTNQGHKFTSQDYKDIVLQGELIRDVIVSPETRLAAAYQVVTAFPETKLPFDIYDRLSTCFEFKSTIALPNTVKSIDDKLALDNARIAESAQFVANLIAGRRIVPIASVK